jgi:hypothetical protein
MFKSNEHVKYFNILSLVRSATESNDEKEIERIMQPYVSPGVDIQESVRDMTNKYFELRSEFDRLQQDLSK